MSKRRRWLPGIALALLAAVVVVWSVLSRGERMGVQVVFIGYTNGFVVRNSTSSGSIPNTLPLAVLMVTNTGSVPVKILPDIRVDTRTNIGEFALPLYGGSAGSLRPGESVMFRALIVDTQRHWWTELAYCRYGLGMRLHDKLWNTGNSAAQGLLDRLPPSPESHWAQSGWITNPPPSFAVPGFQRTVFTPIRGNITIREDRWEPYGRREALPIRESFYFIDDSIDFRQRSRYHITAPPDWKDVDFSDLAPRSRL